MTDEKTHATQGTVRTHTNTLRGVRSLCGAGAAWGSTGRGRQRETALTLWLCGPRGEAQPLCASVSSSGRTATVTTANALPQASEINAVTVMIILVGLSQSFPREA